MSAGLRAGYKQTEVGVIPEDWEVGTIGNLCSAVLDCHHSTPVWTTTGEVVIRNQNIRDGKLDLSQPSHTDAGHFAERTRRAIPTRGDLVITREAPMGLVCMIPEGLKCCLGQRMVLLRPDSKVVDAQYLLYSILSETVQRAISVAGGTGSTVANLRIPVLKELLIAAPSRSEQRAIAAALSDVDALLAKLNEFIAKKRDLKQAAMQQLLTGQIRLPGFSGAWATRPTASFSAFVTKGATPTTYGFKWESDGVIFLRSECVSADGLDLHQSMFISEQAHAALIRGEVRSGDILITITGNVGRVVLLDRNIGVANINQHIARIRITVADVSPAFVFHWLSQPSVRHYYSTITTGQAYPQISLKQVRETHVPLGSIAEQTAIATVLSDMDTELAALEARRDKTRALKQGMMQELLTGRIRLPAN